MVVIKVEGQDINMLIDSGAQDNLIDEASIKKFENNLSLRASEGKSEVYFSIVSHLKITNRFSAPF